MDQFVHFLQSNIVPLTILFSGAGVIASAYFYNTRHYRHAYKICKKIVDKLPLPSDSQKTLEQRVETIKNMVFQLGFSEYFKDYNQRINRLEEKINLLKKELGMKKEAATNKYQEENKKLAEDIKQLEIRLGTKQQELSKLKKEEAGKKEQVQRDTLAKSSEGYFFSGKIKKISEFLSGASQNLERDLLKYLYLPIIILLLAGDWYITYYIFYDILKIQFRNNELIIYLMSGLIALVFLVLIELFFDFIDSISAEFRQLINRLRFFLIIVVGTILSIIYILMVTLSWLPDIPAVLDSLLRLLFLPLILAVALMIRKVQKNYCFTFLFTPIKVILYLLLLAFLSILFLFEMVLSYIRKYFQQDKFESKTKLAVTEEIENIKKEIDHKNNTKSILKQQLESEIDNLIASQQKLIDRLEVKIDRLKSEKSIIVRGCESGFVSGLKLSG